MEDSAIAIFDCIADDASELTFNKGDVIENIQPAADQGWFHGTLQKNKKTGLFPGNYVTFTKKQPKKYSAAEARANLMQKSSNLAQKTRIAGTLATNPEPVPASKPSITKPPIPASLNKSIETSEETQKVVIQIAKTFSETALKSNESLLASESTSSIPKVGKRPPLLVSNQAYVRITDNVTPEEKTDNNTPKVPPPPRPFKPAALRSLTSPVANVPPTSYKDNSTQRDSTISILDDGTPLRPSNTKTLKFSNLDFTSLKKYKNEFKDHDTDNDGFLQGDKIKTIWMKSGLDPVTLGLIWNLCDPGNLGKLDIKGFTAGMFLIDEKLRGVPVPSALPKEFLDKCS